MRECPVGPLTMLLPNHAPGLMHCMAHLITCLAPPDAYTWLDSRDVFVAPIDCVVPRPSRREPPLIALVCLQQ